MNMNPFVFTFLFFTLPLFSQAEVFEISIVKEVEIPKVSADVTIAAGVVVGSNCDSLTKKNHDGIIYNLKQEGESFYCFPSPSTRKVKRMESFDAGGKITMADVISTMAQVGKSYEEEKGYSKGYFTKLKSSTPSCQLNSDGTINFSSCVCESEILSFDSEKRVCSVDPTILSFYIDNCLPQYPTTIRALSFLGARVFPPDSVSFDFCSVVLEQYRVIPHDLVAKIFYFDYLRPWIKKVVKADEDDSIKLIIAQREIDEVASWGKEWAQSQDAQDYPLEVRKRAEKLEKNLQRNFLDGLVEIIKSKE